jgi:hypothetical protein
MIHNIPNAVRTAKQALNHVYDECQAGRLRAKRANGYGCLYESARRHCSVGCLFSPLQIQDIKRRRLNDRSIGVLAELIGDRNIETQTGLPLSILEHMQGVHDLMSGKSEADFKSNFGNYIKGLTHACN